MKLSIVVPSYNQGKFIADCLDSIVTQELDKGTELEVIIIDAKSKDNTAEVVKPYLAKYSFIQFISEKDRGQSDGINKGLRLATGDVVAWLNCDDYYLPGALASVVRYFTIDTTLEWLYGDGILVDENQKMIGPFMAARSYDHWYLVSCLDYVFQPSTFWKKSAMDEIGYLEENLNWGMDWDFFIRLGERSKPAYVQRQLSAQRVYGNTKTATGGVKRLRELNRIMRKHGAPVLPPGLLNYCFGELWPLAEKHFSPQKYRKTIKPWLDWSYGYVVNPLLGVWTEKVRPPKITSTS